MGNYDYFSPTFFKIYITIEIESVILVELPM